VLEPDCHDRVLLSDLRDSIFNFLSVIVHLFQQFFLVQLLLGHCDHRIHPVGRMRIVILHFLLQLDDGLFNEQKSTVEGEDLLAERLHDVDDLLP